MKLIILHRLASLIVFPLALAAQPPCRTAHLTIFDANLAEFLEERTLDLQSGPNVIEWRSLMPQTYIRSIRVTAGDRVTVTRQDVTDDGPEVRNRKSPVLHLVLQNAGAAGARKVKVDYLAPGLSWKGDYAMLLGVPGEMHFDGWVTVQNDTGADVCGASVDLVAGEVQLLLPGADLARSYSANAQISSRDTGGSGAEPYAEVTGMSIFSRFRLGHNIAMQANASVGRFPLFQDLKLPVEQRHIFENEATAQTLGRGGFMLAPRGLEVRLVSRNASGSPIPAGLVTIYSQDDETPQVAGQDQIPLTPPSADFSVTQGRSNLLQGTRRVIERKTVPDAAAFNRSKLVTRVEVVVTNHTATATVVLVREGVENYGGEWTVSETTHSHRKLGDHLIEFPLTVAANGSVTLDYTVESR